MEWRELLDWHLRSFCRGGQWEPEDLLRDVENKRRQLWVAEVDGEVGAAVLTTISDDRDQSCIITHAAGRNRKDWLHLLGFLEDWARSIGCKRLEAVARPGWERILKDMTKTHVVLEKRL